MSREYAGQCEEYNKLLIALLWFFHWSCTRANGRCDRGRSV